MTERKIWHGMFQWVDENGTRQQAFRGDTVDLPDSVIEQYEQFGVFDDPTPEPAVVVVVPDETDELAGTGPVTPDLVPAPAAKPNRPKNTAPEEEWFEYAIALGHSREDAEKAGREGLIQSL